MHLKEKLKEMRNRYVVNQVNRLCIPVFTEGNSLRYHMIFSGRVQHVGFRLEVCLLAERLGLTGWAKNLLSGDVEAEIQGPQERIDFLVNDMKSLRRIKISGLEQREMAIVQGEVGFSVL